MLFFSITCEDSWVRAILMSDKVADVSLGVAGCEQAVDLEVTDVEAGALGHFPSQGVDPIVPSEHFEAIDHLGKLLVTSRVVPVVVGGQH